MKIAIISDIHGNLEALNAVLKKIEEEKPDKIVCLGDIVGYGANPNECCDIVKKLTDKIVMGNHDSAVCMKTPLDWFNPNARTAIEWTMKKLTPDNFDFLSKLPLTLKYENLLFVHASPNSPEEWKYILNAYDAYYELQVIKENVCFIGHSHVPVTFMLDENLDIFMIDREEFFIEGGKKYLINVGSVGQPRDFDPRASFGIYDTDKKHFRIIRVDYDIRLAQRKIIEADLPVILAERLLYGR